MAEETYRPRGRYFEEFEVGQSIVSAGRTITEADIVQFAGLSGDYNRLHTDAAYAAGHMFGARVAHGLLVLSVSVGMAVQTGMVEGTILAFRALDWKFSRPVFIGDTITVHIEVAETKALPRLDGGNVTMKVRVLNQNDEVVNHGRWVMLVKSQN